MLRVDSQINGALTRMSFSNISSDGMSIPCNAGIPGSAEEKYMCMWFTIDRMMAPFRPFVYSNAYELLFSFVSTCVLVVFVLLFFPPYEMEAGRRLANVLDVLGAHTWRSAKRTQPGDVHVVDGNRLANIRTIRHFFARDSRVTLDLHGFTQCGSELWPFPVYCDPRTFLRFLLEFNQLPEEDRRRYRKHGIISPAMKVIMVPLFAPVLSPFACLPLAFECVKYPLIALGFAFSARSIGLVPLLISFVFGCVATSITNYFTAGPHSMSVNPLYVWSEEVLSAVVGPWPVIFWESLMRFHLGLGVVVMPAFLHLFVSFLPFPLRVAVHLMWNRSSVKYGLTCSMLNHATLCNIEDASFAMLVARAVYSRDKIGLAAALGTRTSTIVPYLMTLLNLSDDALLPVRLLDLCSDVLKEEEEVVALAGEWNNPLLDWLPQSVRKSPTFSKIAALVSVILMSSFAQSFYVLERIGAFFTADDYPSGATCLGIVTSAITAVYRGVKRALDECDWRAFFDLPKDVIFSDKVRTLMRTPCTPAGVKDWIEQAEELIDSRRLMTNDIVITRKLEALERELFLRQEISWQVSVKDFLKRVSKPVANDLLNETVDECCCLIEVREYETNNSRVTSRLLESLQSWRDQTVRDHQLWANRPAALPFFLIGPPGAGKSTAIPLVKTAIDNGYGLSPFNGDSLAFEQTNKYPLSSSSNVHASHIIINDALQDYTESTKSNLEPLDVTIQKVIDIFPLSFNAASIEDKKKIFPNVKSLIVTSNHMEYKMAFPAARLKRRLESGVSAYVWVSSADGKRELTFEEVKKLGSGVRNDQVRFTLLEPHVSNRHLSFQRTEVTLTQEGYIAHVEEKIEEAKRTAEAQAAFGQGAPTCVCQFTLACHRTGTPNKQGLFGFKHITARCVKPESGFSKVEIPYVGGQTLGTNLTAAYLPSREDIAQYAPFVCAWIAWELGRYLEFFAFLVYAFAPSFRRTWNHVRFLVDDAVASVKTSTMSWILRSSASDKLIAVGEKCLGVEIAAELRAMRAYDRAKAWVRKYGMAVVVAGGAYAYYRHFFDESGLEVHATPILREQVRADTYQFGPEARQQSFPEAQLRAWGKSAGDIYVRTPVVQTTGVARPDLRRIASEALLDVMVRHDGGNTRYVKMLVLSPEFLLGNRHYFFDADDKPYSERFELVVGGVSRSYSCEDVRWDLSSEAVLVRNFLPCLKKSLLPFLPRRNVEQPMVVFPLNCEESYPAALSTAKLHAHAYKALSWRRPGVKGECSTPILAEIGGNWYIPGIIAYGKGDDTTGAVLVSLEWFEKVTARDPVVVEDVVVHGLPLNIGPLSERSELRNVPTPYFHAIGTTDLPNKKFKSSLVRTIVADAFEPLMSVKYARPARTNAVIDDEYHSSFKATYKHVNLPSNLREDEIRKVNAAYLERVASKELIARKNIKLAPLSAEQAIFGCHDIGVSRIDFTTSTGSILRARGVKTKFEFFLLEEDDMFTFNPEVSALCQEYLAMFSAGQVPTPFMDVVHKDELRPVEKIAACRIRLFFVMCAAYNIVLRMYMMPLIQYMLAHPELSECYGGMNAGSSQWAELAARMKRHVPGWFHFDMDFSSFDTSHMVMVFYAAAVFFHDLALRLGYTPDEARIVYLMFINMSWQVARFNEDVFLKFKGMPSGVIFTLMLNSFVNSFLLRVAYLRIVGDLSTFDKRVITSNVGDDNITTADRTIREKFNMVTIAAVYKDLGYVATPAQKNSVVREEIEFDELTFLKRRFFDHPDLGEVAAPIEMDSIWKSFTYESRDLNTTSLNRLEGLACNAQREAMLHGRETFDLVQSKIRDGFEGKAVWTPLSYDALVAEYKEGSFRTFFL